jgi:hypothetical protein
MGVWVDERVEAEVAGRKGVGVGRRSGGGAICKQAVETSNRMKKILT